MIHAKRFLVKGRVQGVGYRYFALREAERLGVVGFARNLSNGDVEIHAEADDSKLRLFKLELERGPRMSQVAEVVESSATVSEQYSSFQIRG